MRMKVCDAKGKVGIVLFFILSGFMYCTAFAQQTKIQGTVTGSETGEPIANVNIIVRGTNLGTSTNADGHYSLQVPSLQDTLVFSFVGYKTKIVPISGRTTIEVELNPQTILGKELVVVGFGQQERQNVTASISTADMDVVSAQPVANVGEALMGQIAGVNIQSSGGRPGTELDIVIRGRRSLTASNEPLIVVDGMPFSGSLSDISAENIKSISVLKDASATAVYGSRGANGVILVTTKNGGNRDININYDMYYGVTEPLRRPDMMNGREFAALNREAHRRIIKNGNIVYTWKGELPSWEESLKPKAYQGYQNGVSTDWPALVLESGYRQSHNLSVGGGDENTQFYVAGNFFNEQALIPTNEYSRYGLRVNVTQQIGDKFSFDVRSYFARLNKNYNANPLGEALRDSPLGKPYDENGELVFLPVSDGLRSNPLFNLIPGRVLDKRRINKFFAVVSAQYDLLNNLTYELSFAPSITDEREGTFTGSWTVQQRGGPPLAGKYNSRTFDYILRHKLNYNTSFGQGDHQLKVLLLQSIQSHHTESSSIDVRGLPFGSQKFNNLETASVISGIGSGLSEWTLASVLGRINYSYKGKYLLQLSARADGSSRLSAGNRWSIFPGISVGWRITNEPFMEEANFIDNLKLRFSYGVVGNTSISPYQTQGSLNRTVYVYGTEPAYGYRLANIANPNLEWEQTATFDVGLDFSFFNNRISGSLDYYHAKTSNILLERQIPVTSGYDRILQNVGQTKNTGFEVSLKTINFKKNGRNSFSWATNITWSHYQEEIVKLFNKKQDDIGNGWFIGHPINVFYDLQKIGIWQIPEAEEAAKYGQVPGTIKIKDQNNDGEINGADRIILGSPEPDWSAGMTNTFTYNGFNLTILMYAQIGRLLRSGFHDSFNTLQGRYNNMNVDYWTPDNPTDAYPRPNINQESALYSSSMSYFNGNFVKIKNVTLGYNLPVNILNKVGLDKFRIYVTVDNVYVFSPYKVKDPSLSGTIGGTIPTTRAYLAGINLSF